MLILDMLLRAILCVTRKHVNALACTGAARCRVGFIVATGFLGHDINLRVCINFSVSPDQAFGDPVEPPDAEFGCFAAIYGPLGSEHAAAALLRADIGAGRTGRGKAMPMYVSASRQDVARCAVSV